MEPLNLPQASLRIMTKGDSHFVFDLVRKKNVLLTPEEWVRQHFLWYLIDHLHYPRSLIKIESGHSINTLAKRTDIIVYDRSLEPVLLIECKAASTPLNQKVLEQVMIYNQTIRSAFIVITNGLFHQCYRLLDDGRGYSFEESIPSFNP